jgi:hypothetical protein
LFFHKKRMSPLLPLIKFHLDLLSNFSTKNDWKSNLYTRWGLTFGMSQDTLGVPFSFYNWWPWYTPGLNSTRRDLPFDISFNTLQITFSFCTQWPWNTPGLNSTLWDLSFDMSHNTLWVTFSFCTWWPLYTPGLRSSRRDLPFDMSQNTLRKRRLSGAWSFGWDQKNRCPVSKQVWHDKDPFLLKGPERRALTKICSLIPAMVMSSSKWKFLEQDVKQYMINQTYCDTGPSFLRSCP